MPDEPTWIADQLGKLLAQQRPWRRQTVQGLERDRHLVLSLGRGSVVKQNLRRVLIPKRKPDFARSPRSPNRERAGRSN
jgi:hypothetical protein